MNCSRCGARMAGVCPRCDAGQSRNPPCGGLSFAFLPGLRIPDLRGTITTVINRRWGSYRRLLTGALFEGGEHEIARVEVQRFSMYAVDGHTVVGQDAVCILTNCRLIVSDASGHMAQTRLEMVRSARDHREYDSREGFSYGVAINRLGSSVYDPKGDLYLCCQSQSESSQLVELLLHATQGTRAATVA